MSFVFTVFTPTYNRAYVLWRAFESLQKQTYRDFEWIVVDDGSTDNTRAVVAELAQEASFPVRYFYQTHGHKKKAINYGVREARGELFVFLDSDDELMPNALERFNFHWQSIPIERRSKFCGIFGLSQYPNGEVVGALFPGKRIESNLNEMTFRYGVIGERSTVLVSDVLRQYPFPEDISGLLPEGTIWVRMARKYLALFVNEVSRIYYISEDSITPKKKFGAFAKERSGGRALCASELLSHEVKKYFFYNPWKFCAESIIYTRSIMHISSKKFPKIKSLFGLILVIIFFPVGLSVAFVDKICISLSL